MELSAVRTELPGGITCLAVNTEKFKTNRVAVSFLLQLSAEKAAMAAYLSNLLVYSSEKYTHIALSGHLAGLYGASLSSRIQRMGNVQLMTFSLTVLDDDFVPAGEQLSKAAASLLRELLFSPDASGSAFSSSATALQKRLLIEEIDARINEKRSYALSRMIETMCRAEPAGIPDFGGKDAVEEQTAAGLYAYYRTMLSTAPVFLTAIGKKAAESPMLSDLAAAFAANGRSPLAVPPTRVLTAPPLCETVSERFPVAQGKLVMGFRTGKSSPFDDVLPVRMMTDIFGGGPYSRLFTVVREKMNLCYYCAARFLPYTGIVSVDSGVEFVNFDRTREGILDQLSVLRSGDFDDDLLESSRMSLCDAASAATDVQGALESWYLLRLFDTQPDSPADYIRKLNGISKEQVVDAARHLVPDTVYYLKGVQTDD